MYNLEQQIRNYFEFDDMQIAYLFDHFPKHKIHMALYSTQSNFQNNAINENEKIAYFKRRLLSK